MIVVCPMCSTPINRYPCQTKNSKLSFCSYQCRASHQSLMNPFDKKEYMREWRKNNEGLVKSHAKKFYELNKKDLRRKQKEYNLANPCIAKKARAKYYWKNKDVLLLQNKQYYNNSKESLTDTYVKSLLSGNSSLRFSNIPQSLVEAKRAEIQVKRFIKELNNG